MGISAAPVKLTKRQRCILEQLERADKTPQRLAERVRIVLLAEEGRTTIDVAGELGVDRQRVRRWRTRYSKAREKLAAVEEKGADKDLKEVIVAILKDEQRPGVPSKFSAEQVAQLIAIACKKPEDYDVPMSHWTPPELARVLIKQGIVETISPRQVDRFLKKKPTFDPTRHNTGLIQR